MIMQHTNNDEERSMTSQEWATLADLADMNARGLERNDLDGAPYRALAAKCRHRGEAARQGRVVP
jgi:hypothetical protein